MQLRQLVVETGRSHVIDHDQDINIRSGVRVAPRDRTKKPCAAKVLPGQHPVPEAPNEFTAKPGKSEDVGDGEVLWIQFHQ